VLEAEWQKIAIAYLKAHPQVAFITASDSDRKRHQKYRCGKAGHPDLHGFTKCGRALYVELKKPSGGTASLAQKQFINEARNFNVKCGFARTTFDLEAILAQ